MASLDVLSPVLDAPKLPADGGDDDDSPCSTGESDYEQSAVAALLGLAAVPSVFQPAEGWGGAALKRDMPDAPAVEPQGLWRDPSSDDLSTEGLVKRQRGDKDLSGASPRSPAREPGRRVLASPRAAPSPRPA